MKKLLVCVAALGMLFTSCMRDETRLDEGSIVTFKISAPAVSTRAAIEDTYGTGVEADDLHWAIFEQDENGNPTGDPIFENVEEGFFADGTLENTFNVRLVKGKKYVGVFWAQDTDAPYTVNWTDQTVTMNETVSNNEKLDAFFNIHKFAITAGQETGEQQVELRRPFAQLNVAIPEADLEAAKTAGFELEKTGITLNVAKSFSLVTGAVGTAEDVTYTLANIPTDVTATLEGNTYQLISFNYILVDAGIWDREGQAWTENKAKDLTDVTFNYADTNGEELSQTFQNITVQRNHRTYIVGSLLSETVDFRVIILPDWEDPYYLNNMEAGSIEMVAEQTAINKAAMGSATLTWNAVEGAVYYGVEYKGEELGKVNPDGTTRADEATTVTWNTPEGKVTDATASFTIKAYNENDKVIARVVTEPIAVFSLANRPEPAVYVADGKLFVENKELHLTESVKSNLDLNGILLEAEVYFYKDGATTPAYTARGSYIDTYPSADLPLSIKEKKIKNNVAGSYYTWKWDGATTATTALPAFEKGTYTIKYKAGYYPVINASFDRTPTDRIIYTDPSDVLAKMQYREGEVKDFKLVIAEATTPEAVAEGYQGAKVTWPAVDGAASYQVFVGATKVADATTNEATVTGLKDANKYKFIVKSLDANGNVIATSVESNEITVWTLLGMPEPTITFDGTTLAVTDVMDVMGTCVDITIDFKKDGQVAHTASYSKLTSAYGWDGSVSSHINSGRFTNAFFATFIPATATDKNWVWDGTAGAAPKFDVGEYTIEYTASYWAVVNGYWADADKKPTDDPAKYNRVMFDGKEDDVLKHTETSAEMVKKGVLAEKYVVGLNPVATVGKAQYQAATISWNPAAGATGYEVYVGANKVATAAADATSVEVTGLTDDSIYEFTVKALGTSFEATTPKTSIFTFYHWTAPTFAFDGKRMIVSGLCNIDKAGGASFAYGGAITNDNDTSKSTIEIYKDGTLLYTLTNGTGQGTLTAWAGYGRWALGAQDNRKDWIWTNTANEIISVNPDNNNQKEWDVPAGTLPAGTYTLKWTIGYVVNKNANWAKSAGDPVVYTTQATKDGANCIFFGPKDTKPSPHVLYTSDKADAVRIFTKTGEATLTVE